MQKIGYETMGASPHIFETMVFKAGKPCTAAQCNCGLPEIDPTELDGTRYMTAGEATKGHYKFCRKFARLKREVPNAS